MAVLTHHSITLVIKQYVVRWDVLQSEHFLLDALNLWIQNQVYMTSKIDISFGKWNNLSVPVTVAMVAIWSIALMVKMFQVIGQHRASRAAAHGFSAIERNRDTSAIASLAA